MCVYFFGVCVILTAVRRSVVGGGLVFFSFSCLFSFLFIV